ncbi:MAG: glycosyltransferase family 39 protein [Polyangiaceae bacterium]|nr:glycosyltransferase family 39 protein [Polyangiaceae bacterium]
MTTRPTRSDLGFSVALFVVALLPRLFVAIAWAREPVWDGHYYHFGAERIAQGLGYSEDVVIGGQAVWKPWCHYPVGYSAWLGLLYRVLGSDLLVAPVAGALVGALTALLVHRLALFGLSPTRARVAGALAALHPGLIAYSALVMTEGLAAGLLLLAPWVYLRLRQRVLLATVVAGFVFGLAALVRPSSLLAVPLLGLLASGTVPRRGLVALGALAMALVTVLPWTVRNCRVMDGCALISTNGGWNLAIGALTETGRFQTLRAEDGCPIVTGQVQQDRCWASIGRRRIAEAPGRWLALVPKKLSHTFDHESFPVEYLRQANRAAWPEERRVAGRRLLTFAHRGLLVAASLSVVAWAFSRRHRREQRTGQGVALGLLVLLALYAILSVEHPFFWLVVAAPLLATLPLPGRPRLGGAVRYALGSLAVTAATHAIFFGEDRYHMVISPLLCLLAAAGLRRPGSGVTSAETTVSS